MDFFWPAIQCKAVDCTEYRVLSTAPHVMLILSGVNEIC